MCGIAGIWHPDGTRPIDSARLTRMTDAIEHRGPDGSGIWCDGGIGLGHRRLSIIDLEGGAQPMQGADGRLVVSFNGEIYNFRELRAELEEAGHTFASHSDTEVLLAAWAEWGREAVDKLNGMYVFAMFDKADGSLTLVRDRLGVKPLHYAQLPSGEVIFGSELKALTAHPDLSREPDPQAIDAYMAFGYVPDDFCFLKGVKKLPAGASLRLERGARELPDPMHYWDVDFSRRHIGSADELGEELFRLMKQAVASRMVADVPLGAFLSGGVDSSSVVALMSEVSDTPVRTRSIGFDEAKLDETEYARRVAEQYGTSHVEKTVGADDFALVDRLAEMFDEPFADASALPTFRVCELARESVTVALSGDGADEAFAGYRRHVFHHGEERARALIPAPVRRWVLGPAGTLYPKADWAPRPLRAKTTLLSLARDGVEGYAEAVGVTPPRQRDALYGAAMKGALGGWQAESRMHDLMRGAPVRSGLDAAQYADIKMYLPGDILTKVDRTSMAVSLEAREPLLDYRLIEFAAGLPEELRVKRGQGKWLMKRSMESRLPNDILYRPKMGFVTPLSQWFRGPLQEQARGLAKSAVLADHGWIDGQEVACIADAHISGRSDHGRLLWQLFMLEKSAARVLG